MLHEARLLHPFSQLWAVTSAFSPQTNPHVFTCPFHWLSLAAHPHHVLQSGRVLPSCQGHPYPAWGT